MPRHVNFVNLAAIATKTATALQDAERWASDQARPRTAAAKAGLLDALDALRVDIDNLAAAIQAAHVFDVRAVGDAVRVALGEVREAERRVVRESGLEIGVTT